MTSVIPVATRRRVVIGVDTHKNFHVAVALDHNGGRLGELQFATSQAGLAQLQTWAGEFGDIAAWGVEGTASYGAGLTAGCCARVTSCWR